MRPGPVGAAARHPVDVEHSGVSRHPNSPIRRAGPHCSHQVLGWCDVAIATIALPRAHVAIADPQSTLPASWYHAYQGQPNGRRPTRPAKYSPATREVGVVKCGSLSATPAAFSRTAHRTIRSPTTSSSRSSMPLADRVTGAGRARSSARSSGSTISAISVTSSTCSRRRYEAHSAEGRIMTTTPARQVLWDLQGQHQFAGAVGVFDGISAPGPTHRSGCGLHDRCQVVHDFNRCRVDVICGSRSLAASKRWMGCKAFVPGARLLLDSRPPGRG